ncbi:MAG TPA: hemerythrin domain-containing protein [Caldimonas sp.]|jgi:hemerythrin superfamily protein|nr:hemerythrin domain-containing protein [Caldimonas sp.]HEX2539899.1 hemerythrin domain-containing protein [Caldimonas sp.]
MPAAKKTAAKKAPAKKTPAKKSSSSSRASGGGSGARDALALLKADHKEVNELFKQYEKMADAEAEAEERQTLAEQICDMLTVHATIEEEIFYPAARESEVESDLLDEAEVEHASAKDLIAQIKGMSPEDELYDAKVKVLGEYVNHHVQEEEGEMFQKCRKAKMDLATLGTELEARKSELMEEMAGGIPS